MKYNVKEKQNGIDIANSIYGYPNIYDIYLNNDSFDVNVMQKDSDILYFGSTANNVYVNDEIKNYYDLFFITLNKSKYVNSLDVTVYDIKTDTSFLVDCLIKTDDENVIVSDDYELILWRDKNLFNIAIDNIAFRTGKLFNGFTLDNVDISEISLNEINIGGDFSLHMNNCELSSWSFLNKLKYVNENNRDNVIIHVADSVKTLAKINNLVNSILASSIKDANGVIVISSNDHVPTGTNWATLSALGWTYDVI